MKCVEIKLDMDNVDGVLLNDDCGGLKQMT